MTNTPAPTPDPNAPERQVFRSALRAMLVLLGGLAVVGIVVGLLVAGEKGLWGALVGVVLTGFFCATTIWSMLRTVGATPATMAAFVMGSWLVKLVVLIVVLSVLRGRDFYDPYVLFGVVAVGAIGSALLDYRAVSRGRITYFQP